MAGYKVPRFSYETDSFSIKEKLQTMGMQDAFIEGIADFSGINGKRDLSLGDVCHKAFISVDEDGTGAIAATAVVFATGSAPPAQPIELTVNRPFIFLIRDISTNTIIFMGSITSP